MTIFNNYIFVFMQDSLFLYQSRIPTLLDSPLLDSFTLLDSVMVLVCARSTGQVLEVALLYGILYAFTVFH